MNEQSELVTLLQEKQKELGVMIIIEMKQSNATKGKVETEIENGKGKWKVTTMIESLSNT